MSRIVIALGGNALGNTPQEQQKMIEDAVPALVGLIRQGHEIIISHGNGPQVGMIKLAFDIAGRVDEKVPAMNLPECTAMSQGYIGFHLQKGIKEELHRQGMPWQVVSVVTQMIVDKDDPAFLKPAKPIGSFYSKEEAEKRMEEEKEIVIKEDAGRGYRQMVASPKPINIVEKDSIKKLLDHEFIVIACGGGGIPVIEKADGSYESVAAVIDKDYASAKLAELVEADYLFILTAVDHVAINFGKENQKNLTEITVAEAKQYCGEGQFAAGSMRPKVEAAIGFVEGKKGRTAVIASLEKAPLAMLGESGTKIVYE